MVSRGGGLLERVVASLHRGEGTPSSPGTRSILTQAATSYAKRPSAAEETIPTGFDPRAAVLFEAVVEAAFLVANADGVFDPEERRIFEAVVMQACEDELQPGELHELVGELCRTLESEGLERRVGVVCEAVRWPVHKLEVLRIAALMAHISRGVQRQELEVLHKLAQGMGLSPEGVEAALRQAERALRGE